jgi:hypothetical protein
MTPNFAVIHIHNAHWRGLNLWVPLFLLWIPLLLLSPLILLVVLAGCIAGRLGFFHAVKVFWDILCGLKGTDVRVTADGNNILVRIL